MQGQSKKTFVNNIISFLYLYYNFFIVITSYHCVNLYIQSNCGNIRTRKTPNMDNSGAVYWYFFIRILTILLTFFPLLQQTSKGVFLQHTGTFLSHVIPRHFLSTILTGFAWLTGFHFQPTCNFLTQGHFLTSTILEQRNLANFISVCLINPIYTMIPLGSPFCFLTFDFWSFKNFSSTKKSNVISVGMVTLFLTCNAKTENDRKWNWWFSD